MPRRGDQGPKTIDQIHKEAELEEHREQMKVQQALISKKDTGGGPGGRMGGGGPGRRDSPHTPGRGAPPQDEGWNTVPISKNRPIDTSRLSKITKVREEGPLVTKHSNSGTQIYFSLNCYWYYLMLVIPLQKAS